MHHGDKSFILQADTSILIGKMYGIREDLWCSPTLSGILSVNHTLLFTWVIAPLFISYIILTHFSGTPFSLIHLQTFWRGTLSHAFSRSINTICSLVCFPWCFSIRCRTANIASVFPLPGMQPNCSSPIVVSSLRTTYYQVPNYKMYLWNSTATIAWLGDFLSNVTVASFGQSQLICLNAN